MVYAKQLRKKKYTSNLYTFKTDPVSLISNQRRISRARCYFSPVQRLGPWWLRGRRWGQPAGGRRGSTNLSKLKIHLLCGPNSTSREMLTHASVDAQKRGSVWVSAKAGNDPIVRAWGLDK